MRSTRRNYVSLAVACAVIATAGTVASIDAPGARAAPGNAVVPNSSIAGFTPTQFAGNDDGTYPGAVPLGFDINFFGNEYSAAYVNNNGNITFDGPLSVYTPFGLQSTSSVIIAPFFADVDTRVGNTVEFGTGTLNGHAVFVVNWPGVGCYDENNSVIDNFQLILTDRVDRGTGALGDDFDIEFNYNAIAWDTGSSSGGNPTTCTNPENSANGAAVGFSNGTPAGSFELPGSQNAGSFLDSNETTGLIYNELNSGVDGRYDFSVESGEPSTPPGAPTIQSVVAGNGAVSVSFVPGAEGSAETTGYVASCTSPERTPGSNTGTSSPIVVSGLTNGAEYTCSVVASSSAGDSPSSASSAPVTPTASSKKIDTCADDTACHASVAPPPSPFAPRQSAQVTGTPSNGAGAVVLTSTLGRLGCKSISGSHRQPITKLKNTGFSAQEKLTVTLTLKIASSTAAGKVCYNSAIPFLSESSPTVKHAGTGYLLRCTKTGNVAPCVISSKPVGANISVKLFVPGGDPRFCVLMPRGRLQWLAGSAIAKVKKAFSAQLQSTGGRAPVHWKISTGKLPTGLGLNGSTGSISGTPTVKGSQTAVVAGTDSASPPKTAKLSVPIQVK